MEGTIIHTKVLLVIVYLSRFHSRSHIMFTHGFSSSRRICEFVCLCMPGMTYVHSSVFRLIRKDHKDIIILGLLDNKLAILTIWKT